MPPPDGTPQSRSPGQPPGARAGNGREPQLGLTLPSEPDSAGSFAFPWSFVAGLAFLVCMAMYAWLWVALGAPVGAALFTIPVLVALTAPILVHASRTERRFDLAGLLALGLLLRFIAMYYRFDHAVDARTYNLWGTRLADSFRELNFAPDTGANVPGTGSMRYISGLAHLLSNDDELGAFLILTWLAFLGCYLLYRAFVIAVPDGDRYRYACLLFFWPSVVLWPSSIGKEAVILFSIGVAALGTARLFTRRPGGYILLFVGILVTYLVRPHVALIVLVALGFGLVVGRGHPRPTRAMTPGSIAKLAAIVLLLAAMSVVTTRTANYLGIENLQPTTTEEAFQETQAKTAQGGSEFTPPDATNPIGYWHAAVTILFRPFPFEAHASDQLATSLEALALALLVLASWRRLVSVPWRLRVQPYVGLALAFVLVFFFVFAAISNFGIIARERTMMLPFVFVLLSVTALSASAVTRSPIALRRRSVRAR